MIMTMSFIVVSELLTLIQAMTQLIVKVPMKLKYQTWRLRINRWDLLP